MEISRSEREQVASDLRCALADAQLTQDAFARLIGTSRPRLSAYLNGRTMPSAALYLRAVRTGAGFESARRHGWMTPDHTSEQLNAALAGGDEDWAFKLVVQARDHLAEMLDREDPAADTWLLRSTPVTDPRYDALLSALVEHEFDLHHHPLCPEWTRQAQLKHPWLQPNIRRGPDWTRAHTPPWLAKRKIYISDLDLKTA